MTTRILYWSQQYWPSIGGVEVLAAAFIRGMRRRGFEFTVVTSHGHHPLPDAEVHDGVAIRRLPFARALQERDLEAVVGATRALAELKRQVRPALVHLQLSDASALFHLRTHRLHPAPTLVSLQVAPPERMPPESLLAELLCSASWITAPSRAVAGDIAGLLPSVQSRISVIHPALEPAGLEPTALPLAPATLLCLGRLVGDKGFDVALEALPSILVEFPDTRLVIAGDGAARREFERQAARLGIEAAVEFTGWVAPDAVPALINRATVVLVPSRWREAFGIVALQAAQMGRPVVCTDTGGLPEVVDHERTGLIVPVEDPEALAAATTTLLRRPQVAGRLGAQARRQAGTRFRWDRQLDDYEALYRRLTSGSGADPGIS